jgi:hypothetical protein
MPSISQIEEFTKGLSAASPTEPDTVEEEQAQEPQLGEEIEQEPVEAEQEQPLVFFNELPEKYGIDAEDFYKLKLKTDTGQEYTLSEVKDQLQTYSRQQEELARQQEVLQAKERELITQFQQTAPREREIVQLEQHLSNVQMSKQQLLSQLSQLQEEGDANSLIRAQTQLLQLDHAEQQLTGQLNNLVSASQEQRQQRLMSYKQEQFNLLLNKIPDLRNDDTRKATFAEMKEFMAKEGITPAEANQLYDARHAAIVYKAMLWDKHQRDVANTKQTLSTGKLTTRVAGAGLDRKAAEANKLDAAIERGTKSNREKDKRAAFTAVAKKAGLI